MKLFYSVDEFHQDVAYLVNEIKVAAMVAGAMRYTHIMGVPRGGTPLAMALSRELGIPLLAPTQDRIPSMVLIADDVIDSGATRMHYPSNDFVALHLKKGAELPDPSKSSVITLAAHLDVTNWLVYWWEKDESGSVEDVVTRMLQYIGEDPKRDGLKETPSRVVRSWAELFSGYHHHPHEVFKVFECPGADEMVVLRDIEFYSTCEHHLLPFHGRAHIGYIPRKKVIGVSKLARLLDIFSRRVQIQERIGVQVTEALMEFLDPLGAGCVIEARHLCMKCRGVQKQDSVMVTSSLQGTFRTDPAARSEFLRFIDRGSRL